MSKRFGRNQKRRMRQELESLDKLCTRDQQAIANMRARSPRRLVCLRLRLLRTFTV